MNRYWDISESVLISSFKLILISTKVCGSFDRNKIKEAQRKFRVWLSQQIGFNDTLRNMLKDKQFDFISISESDVHVVLDEIRPAPYQYKLALFEYIVRIFSQNAQRDEPLFSRYLYVCASGLDISNNDTKRILSKYI